SINAPPTTEISTLSLHDALPIWGCVYRCRHTRSAQPSRCGGYLHRDQSAHVHPQRRLGPTGEFHFSRRWDLDQGEVGWRGGLRRSEEHTSELQSLAYLVCRLLLE